MISQSEIPLEGRARNNEINLSGNGSIIVPDLDLSCTATVNLTLPR